MSGNPIRDICFNSTIPEPPLPQSLARTDAQGRYRITREISGMWVGPCDVNEWVFGWGPPPGGPIIRESLPAGTVTTKDIVLPERGSVRGVVVNAAGTPVPDVCVSMPGGQVYSDLAERTGPDGRFVIHNVDPGDSTPNLHECVVYGRRLPLMAQSVTVRPGQWTDLTLVIPANTP